MRLSAFILLAVLVGIGAAQGVAVWKRSQGDSIVLKRSEWFCTSSKLEYMAAPQVVRVCNQWSRKREGTE